MGHRARPTKMNGLLVLSTLAAASAQVVLPYGGLAYGGLAGYPYGGLAGYPYAVAKPVVNEVEVPVPVVQYAAIDTGCKNSFGHAVASVLPYGLGYAGLGYHGLGYAGPGYAGLGYAGVHGYPYAVAAPAPVEVEVPVTQYKYVPEVKTVELPPACQNAFGFAVPCA